MTDMEVMEKIFIMYRFDRSMPDSVRSEALAAKKDILISVLKSVGKYTVMTAVIIHLVFVFKKFGIGMSIAKAYFAVKAAIVVTASAAIVTTGSVILTLHTEKKSPRILQTQPSAEPLPPAVPDANKITARVSYKFEIIPLTSSPDMKREADSFNQKLRKSIDSAMGGGVTTLSHGTDTTGSPYVIGGSFSRIGDTYYISIRVIDSERSLTKTVINKTCSPEEIDTVVDDISESIAGMKL